MMRRTNLATAAGLAMALSMAAPMAVWAGEHGGQEHGGAAVAHEGSHGMATADKAALLTDAAAALRKGQARPDLAAKLEELAKAHE